jgi:hypothetical protein
MRWKGENYWYVQKRVSLKSGVLSEEARQKIVYEDIHIWNPRKDTLPLSTIKSISTAHINKAKKKITRSSKISVLQAFDKISKFNTYLH